jgi:phospholipid/cholesterol/gamma-HCH transport system substrate-binding protein
MIRSRFTTARVGILIAFGIAVFCFAIFSLGYGSRYFRRTVPLKAHFHRTNGLLTGAPVALAGVNIGAVSGITFPRDAEADYVVVYMWVDERAFQRLRSNSVARIRTMGMLGDKFIELAGGSARAGHLEPGRIIASRDPIDYEEMLQKEGNEDLLSNMAAISMQLRQLLTAVNSRQSLFSELIMGESGPPDQRLSLATIKKNFEAMNRLSGEMESVLLKIDRGKGLLGAMVSDKTNGESILRNISSAGTSVRQAAESTRASAETLREILGKYGNGGGAIPKLFTDREYGDQTLANIRDASAQLDQILRKINSGQGSLGLAVNDPELYNNATAFLGGSGPGWGLRIMNALSSITHPFANPQPETPPEPELTPVRVPAEPQYSTDHIPVSTQYDGHQ